MQKQISIAEAKNKLPSIIHTVEDGPAVQLTRHGKPVAVLLSVHEYERLSGKKEGFWRALTAFRKAVKEEGIQISNSDFEVPKDRSAGREVEWIK